MSLPAGWPPVSYRADCSAGFQHFQPAVSRRIADCRSDCQPADQRPLFIPKGFRLKAQGCPAGTTLGGAMAKNPQYPEGVLADYSKPSPVPHTANQKAT